MKFHKYIAALLVSLMFGHNLYADYLVREKWSTYAGGEFGNDSVNATVLDDDGMLYFGGAANGEILNDDEVSPTEPPYYQSAKDGFVAQVDSAGVLRWYVMLGVDDLEHDGDDEVKGLAAKGQFVYAATCYERTSTNDDGVNAYLFALSKTDGAVDWSYSIGAPNTTNAFNALTLDTNGNIYAVGHTSMAQIDSIPGVAGYQVASNGTTFGQSPRGDCDGLVVKFAPDGTALWIHYFGGENYDSALACTIGANGFLYVGGETESTGWVSRAGDLLPSPSKKAGFVVKMSQDGDHLWSTYLGGSADDCVNALAFESGSGKLFAAGTTESANYMSQKNPLNLHHGGADGFVTSISEDDDGFTINWSRFYGAEGGDTITSVEPLNDCEVVVGGTTADGEWLPDARVEHRGGVDGFMVVLDARGGDNIWSTHIGGDHNEALNSVATGDGVFYAGGMTRSESWVSNGFHTAWDKSQIFPEDPSEEFGFLCRYESPGFVPDLPQIISQPLSLSVEEQRDALFSVAAIGTPPLFYQWSVNGAPLAGATNAVLTFDSVQLTQNGDFIACVLSNEVGTTISDNALLTVTPIPNGWITVDLSPAAAVAAGALWSVDGGTNWLAGGAAVNLITGDYSIVCADDLFGWAPPDAPLSTTVVNGATNLISAQYTEIFYSNHRAINGTNVTVSVDPPAGSVFFFVSETLPEGLTPCNYAPLTWDSANRVLKYSTSDATPSQFTYSVRGTNGTYRVSGYVNFGEGSSPTAGPDEVIIGATPEPPRPDIIGFALDDATGHFLLTFISVAGRDYRIMTNSAPAASGWAPQGQVAGDENQTTTAVPASRPALFYRIRTPAP